MSSEKKPVPWHEYICSPKEAKEKSRRDWEDWTLDELLQSDWMTNAWITYPGFASLYVRKCIVQARINGRLYKVNDVITIANAVAKEPGKGAFTALVHDLVYRGFAVHVENVLTERFAAGLLRMGFLRLEEPWDNFLFNYKGHLELWEKD